MRLINNRFEIKRKLGVGGMGEVYLCFDERLSRKVALKRISAEKDDNEARARFLREARVASQLDHANICPIYEIYEEDQNQYIVMQYVDGVTLDTIRKHQKLSQAQIIDIALQVCQGMQLAHDNGVVHRDIKAANIMIDRQGRVKILDFGLAKMHRSQTLAGGGETIPMTEKGMVIGTVTHMSPEQAQGDILDARTDIFSFGVVLYELLEGRNPFWSRDTITTLYNIIHSEPVYSDSLPDMLRQVLDGCLEKNRKKRIQTFSELADHLAVCQRTFGGHEDSQPGHTEILSGNEVEIIKKAVGSSDGNQDLKDIVYRINRFKATTTPVQGQKKRMTWLVLVALIPLILLGLWALGLLPPGQTKDKPAPTQKVETRPVAIMVEPFLIDGKASERGETLAELVVFALNQYPGLAGVMPGWFADSSPVLARLIEPSGSSDEDLGDRVYLMRGEIQARKDDIELRAELVEKGSDKESYPITLTGPGTASLINHQVKALCDRVSRRILGDAANAQITHLDLPGLFGDDWDAVTRYFEAQKAYRRLEFSRSEKILKTVSFMPSARYLLAEIAFFNGDRPRATELIQGDRTLLTQYPFQLAHLFRSLDHRLETRPDMEVEQLKELVAQNPLDKTIQYRLGEAYFHNGDAQAAIPYYQAALKLDAVFPPALNHLAYCYSYLGQHDQAFLHFEKYHQLDRSANSFDSFGDGYFYAGDLIQAQAFKESALADKPGDFAWALLTLADIHILKGEYSQADLVADRYAGLSEGDARVMSETLTRKAWGQMVHGQPEAALGLLDQALELEARTVEKNGVLESWDHCRETHWLRGWALEKLGRLIPAKDELSWLETLVKTKEMSSKRFSAVLKYAHHLRAQIRMAEGDPDAAEAELREILNYGPRLNYWITYYNQSFFHCELIRLLIKQNRFDEAWQEVETAARFNPRYPPLLWLELELSQKTDRDPEPLRRQLRDVLGTKALQLVPPPILIN
jgi:serine/threonine protein kinase/tetratricopeptide (TPR) repeat protein